MAYNYFPNYYMGYQTPQQNYQVQQQQTNFQTGMMWVNGEDEAKNYPVAPNNAVPLWDSSGQYVYVKQADASGKPAFKKYKLTETEQHKPEQTKTADYITRSEFDVVISTIEKMQKEMDSLKGGADDE
jgi:hypothetical protein